MPPGAWGPPPGYGPPPPGAAYEFGPEEDRLIGATALWARILGIVLIVAGAAALFSCNVLSTALNVTVGVFLLMGASSFYNVVNTQGNDIGNVLMALSRIGTAFKVRVIATIVFAVLVVLLVGVIALFIASVASK
jgi:hypothetical protein